MHKVLLALLLLPVSLSPDSDIQSAMIYSFLSVSGCGFWEDVTVLV